MIKLKYTVRNSKKTKLNKQKTKEHMKCSYMYVYTCMIFAAGLSSTIKIFHRYLGPNLYIFRCKSFTVISPTFYRDFMTCHCHFTAKKHWPRWFPAKNLCILFFYFHESDYIIQILKQTRNDIPWYILEKVWT